RDHSPGVLPASYTELRCNCPDDCIGPPEEKEGCGIIHDYVLARLGHKRSFFPEEKNDDPVRVEEPEFPQVLPLGAAACNDRDIDQADSVIRNMVDVDRDPVKPRDFLYGI